MYYQNSPQSSHDGTSVRYVKKFTGSFMKLELLVGQFRVRGGTEPASVHPAWPLVSCSNVTAYAREHTKLASFQVQNLHRPRKESLHSNPERKFDIKLDFDF